MDVAPETFRIGSRRSRCDRSFCPADDHHGQYEDNAGRPGCRRETSQSKSDRGRCACDGRFRLPDRHRWLCCSDASKAVALTKSLISSRGLTRTRIPGLTLPILYGFNFQWLCSWKPDPKGEPADEKALDFLAEFGFNFLSHPARLSLLDSGTSIISTLANLSLPVIDRLCGCMQIAQDIASVARTCIALPGFLHQPQ